MIRTLLRWLLALLYVVAGVFHLVRPGPFIAITPDWVPFPAEVILLTGLAELAGAAGLVQPWSAGLRRAAGWGLAAYALCVWPANFQHMLIDLARPTDGLGLAYHVPRLAFQPVLIWLAWWVSRTPVSGRGGKAPREVPGEHPSTRPVTCREAPPPRGA